MGTSRATASIAASESQDGESLHGGTFAGLDVLLSQELQEVIVRLPDRRPLARLDPGRYFPQNPLEEGRECQDQGDVHAAG